MKELTKKQRYQEAEYKFPYHYLDLAVAEYKFRNIEYLSYLNVVKNLLKPFKGQSILDAGCGDGRFCFELRNENVKLVGVDFSERAIAFARVFNPNAQFFIQDLKELNIPYKFDYIVLIETLEHLIPNEINIILHNLADVLKTHGKLIITVPSTNLPLPEKHYQHFTKESLEKILDPPFKIIRVLGHSKICFKRRIFIVLRRFGIFLAPFMKKVPCIVKFHHFLSEFYYKYLETGPPEICERLIVVCEKRNKHT